MVQPTLYGQYERDEAVALGAMSEGLEQDVFGEIVKLVRPVPISPWRWQDTRFYVRDGAFMFANSAYGIKREYPVWFGAKTEHPLQFLKPFVGSDWLYVGM